MACRSAVGRSLLLKVADKPLHVTDLLLLEFAAALCHMVDKGAPTPTKERVNAAVSLSQALSNNAVRNSDSHTPNEHNIVRPADNLVYDDVL